MLTFSKSIANGKTAQEAVEEQQAQLRAIQQEEERKKLEQQKRLNELSSAEKEDLEIKKKAIDITTKKAMAQKYV